MQTPRNLIKVIRLCLLIAILINYQKTMSQALFIVFFTFIFISTIFKLGQLFFTIDEKKKQFINTIQEFISTSCIINIQIELTEEIFMNLIGLQFILNFFIDDHFFRLFQEKTMDKKKQDNELKILKLYWFKIFLMLSILIIYQIFLITSKKLWKEYIFYLTIAYILEIILFWVNLYQYNKNTNKKEKQLSIVNQTENQFQQINILENLSYNNENIDFSYFYFSTKHQQLQQNNQQQKIETDLLLLSFLQVMQDGLIVLEQQEFNINFKLRHVNEQAQNMLNTTNKEEILEILQNNQIQKEKNFYNSQNLNINYISQSYNEEVNQAKQESEISINKKLQTKKINSQQEQSLQNFSNLKEKNIIRQSQPHIKKSLSKKLNLHLILKDFIEQKGYQVVKKYDDFNKLPQETLIIRIKIQNEEKLFQLTLSFVQFNQKYVIILIRNAIHHEFIKNLQWQNKQKSKTISYVSHEFRTPLGCIITMLRQYNDEMKSKQFQKITQNLDQENQQDLQFYVDSALANAEYLLSLSNDLLDLAQIKVGKFRIQKELFNLKRLCQSVLDLFKLQSERKKIQLLFEYSPIIEQIYSDQNRIKQILINLLGNAFKFTSQGYIKLKIQVVFKTQILIIIEDSGIGIEKKNIEKLFKAFGKINSEESKKLNQQGVGLGLLISNMIASILNYQGKGLEVESEYLKGIIVRIYQYF